jgi:ubiquitin carboxyl-terminal hydrolase 9/24
MIKGETLDGDNAYYCDRCDKKVSAVKRVCLKKLPNYLIVALKRF